MPASTAAGLAVAPHRVGVVPARAQSFQHRSVDSGLRGGTGSAYGEMPRCAVLTGMGGVGKTQLAADFALGLWDEGAVEVLVWVTAGDRPSIVSAFGQAGVEICGADPGDVERAVSVFLAWLGSTRRRWLVVLDDVDDSADLRGLWPPDKPAGLTVVTTRRQDAALTGTGRREIPVGLFTAAEAAGYLTRTLDAHDRPQEAATELAGLAEDLGHLPLALAQAAVYLVDQAITAAEYRTLLADRTRTLADVVPRPGEGLPDDQPLPVVAVWSLSIQRADTLHPAGLARPMLGLASVLDPNGIPESVLTSAPARAALSADRPVPVTRADAVAALRLLHRFSLIDHVRDGQATVRVHRLVQRAVRETLAAHQRDRLALAAADALAGLWPEVERDTALARALRANTAALSAVAPTALYLPDAHRVLYRTGRSLAEAGQAAAARDHFRQLVSVLARTLGPGHRAVLRARGDAAYWQGDAGDPGGAAVATATLLDDQVRLLGADDRDTQGTRHNCAHWRGVAGDAPGAAADLALLLEDRLRVLGAEDPDTLTTRSALARWRGEAGDPTSAVADLTALLRDRTRVLGAHHPITLTTRSALARWRGEAGDQAGAVAELRALTAVLAEVLSPDDPRALAARGELARWQGEAGNLTAAVTDLTVLLDHCDRVLGPQHPFTADIRRTLAAWRAQAQPTPPPAGV